MVSLVSLADAKRHLYVDFDDHDFDIDLKIESATEIVIDYIKRPDHGWTEEDVPPLIRAAILLVLADLYEHRGDEEPQPGPADGYLDKTVTRILHRYRDPALA